VEVVAADAEKSLRYERVGRRSGPSRIVVKARAEADGVVRVRIGGAVLERFSLGTVHPGPVPSGAHDGRLGVSSRADLHGRVAASFATRAEGLGVSRGTVWIDGWSTDISMFLYP